MKDPDKMTWMQVVAHLAFAAMILTTLCSAGCAILNNFPRAKLYALPIPGCLAVMIWMGWLQKKFEDRGDE